MAWAPRFETRLSEGNSLDMKGLRAQMRENGYVILRNWLSPDLQKDLCNAMAKLQDEVWMWKYGDRGERERERVEMRAEMRVLSFSLSLSVSLRFWLIDSIAPFSTCASYVSMEITRESEREERNRSHTDLTHSLFPLSLSVLSHSCASLARADAHRSVSLSLSLSIAPLRA
jgi:hypothetical protein